MGDGSSRTIMVDERQTVREVLEKLFEKTHCDGNIDWSLCETNPELQIGEMSTSTQAAHAIRSHAGQHKMHVKAGLD